MYYRIVAFSLLVACAQSAAQAPVTDATGASIDQRIANLERMVSSRTNAQHRVQEQLDSLQEEVTRLQGSIEEHNYQLEKILERQRELYLEIDKRIEAMQNTTAVQSTVQQNSNSGVTPSNGIQVVDTVGESKAYEKAVNLILRDKKYDQAIPEFQAFLQQYPASSYTANAHYWLGQLLFNKQDWSAASEQFANVVTKFPDSSKRADALLKLGIAENERGNNTKAKQTLNQLLKEYPSSSAAKLAKSRLKTLN